VPALGGKMDLLPDGVNTLILQADEPGEHLSQHPARRAPRSVYIMDIIGEH
jgi:hypothetical protein